MINLSELEQKIEADIYKKLRELKTELFESSGQSLGRNWDDLTPKYKKFKQKAIGHAYPINIFSGYLLQSLIDSGITIDTNYDEDSDNLSFKINLDTDKIGLDYAEAVNEKREYISLSEEEKSIIHDLVISIVEEYLHGEL
jgi:ribosomal protein L29